MSLCTQLPMRANIRTRRISLSRLSGRNIMSKSLVCFEIDNENLGALAPIFVYAENLHIEPVKVSDRPYPHVDPVKEPKRREHNGPKANNGRTPTTRSIHNPDVRNYKHSRVQECLLKHMQRDPN